MKKLLVPFLIVFLFSTILVSCNSNTADNSVKNTPGLDLNQESVEINIYRPPVGNFSVFSELENWESFIQATYDIDVKVNYIAPLHQSAIASSTYYPGAIKNGDIHGLIELNLSDLPNLGVLKNEGLILPLDEYLADNQAFQALPESIRSAFKFYDGQTWALAVSSPEGVGGRFFRKSWLDVLDLKAPATLEELYQVSKAFTYEDPNGNGENDEYGMNVNRRTGARMMNDIFLANECYLSNYTACSISYDHTTNAYEDAVLKPGMIKSLEYIKALNDSGLLHLSQEWSFMESDRLGNYYDFSNFWVSSKDPSEWEQVYYLGDERSKCVVALKPYKCFVLTSNTENPGSVINGFVNIFLSDISGMALGSFGIPDTNYNIEGTTLYSKYESSDSEGSDFYENNIWLTGLNHDMLNMAGVTIESGYLSEDYLINGKKDISSYNELMEKGILFTDSWFLPHQEYKNVQRTFAIAMYTFYFEMDNINIRDYLNNYIESAKKAGAQQILNDLNEDIGAMPTYAY